MRASCHEKHIFVILLKSNQFPEALFQIHLWREDFRTEIFEGTMGIKKGQDSEFLIMLAALFQDEQKVQPPRTISTTQSYRQHT